MMRCLLLATYGRRKPLSNEFLRTVNPLGELAEKFAPTVDDEDVPSDTDDLQRFQLIAQWREGAYRNFERL